MRRINANARAPRAIPTFAPIERPPLDEEPDADVDTGVADAVDMTVVVGATESVVPILVTVVVGRALAAVAIIPTKLMKGFDSVRERGSNGPFKGSGLVVAAGTDDDAELATCRTSTSGFRSTRKKSL
jgi:hypothetical protein